MGKVAKTLEEIKAKLVEQETNTSEFKVLTLTGNFRWKTNDIVTLENEDGEVYNYKIERLKQNHEEYSSIRLRRIEK